MQLLLERFEFSDTSTIGKLYVDGEFFCFTLEDKDRRLEDGGVKVYGETCIPRGSYQVIIDFSNRFKIDLPRIVDVPQFTGIRIHPGNKAQNTEGCILVGSSHSKDWISNSKPTFAKLFELLDHTYDVGEQIEIEIR